MKTAHHRLPMVGKDAFARGRIVISLFFMSSLAAYVGFAPLYFPMPADALASSWRAVLGEAPSLGFRFGEDIIYSGGPLSPLYGRYFQADHFVLHAICGAIVIAALAASVTILASQTERRWLGYTLAGILLVVSYPRDCLFLSVPFLTALIGLSGQKPRAALTGFSLGIMASAIVTLAKFSAFPIALFSFAVVDSARLAHKRFPVFLLAYLAVLFALFSWLEHPVG